MFLVLQLKMVHTLQGKRPSRPHWQRPWLGPRSTLPPGSCYHDPMHIRPPRRADSLTIINRKGGVGKTHTVWLRAGLCQEREEAPLC